MLLIPGPNGSGKTIYLHQVALITFLAHMGSYVPADEANIGLVRSIYSRLQTFESASVRLSSFMIDITQVMTPHIIKGKEDTENVKYIMIS